MSEIDSPFTALLGDTPQNRVLAFLLEHKESDYTKTDLARHTHLSRPTIYSAIEPLSRFNMIIVSRKIANTSLYRLNCESKAVRAFMEFNEELRVDRHRFEHDHKKIKKILEKRRDVLIALS